jgi:hypothetical protein
MGSSSKTTARIIGQTQPSLRETAITHLGGLLAIDAKPLATLAHGLVGHRLKGLSKINAPYGAHRHSATGTFLRLLVRDLTVE